MADKEKAENTDTEINGTKDQDEGNMNNGTIGGNIKPEVPAANNEKKEQPSVDNG